VRAVLLDDGLRLDRNYPAPHENGLLPGEALVRVRRAGVCNTDLELMRGYAAFRGVPGHEFVGVVEACPTAPHWEGRRVVGEINVACGACDDCHAGRGVHCASRTVVGIRGRDGAFADYMTLTADNLHAVPDPVSDDQAVFVEPLAAAVQITQQVHVRPTERVVVLGDGKLGQLIAQVLALTGCDLTIVGRHRSKLDILAARGIDTLLADRSNPSPLTGADLVVEATGTQSGFEAALQMVRPCGTLVLKSTYHGVPQIDLSRIVVDEVQIVGSRCGPFDAALRLLEQGLIEVEPLIQARFPLDQGVAALERAGVKGTLKVLIEI